MDTGHLSTAQSAEQQQAEQLFNQQLLRAGAKVERGDGVVITPRTHIAPQPDLRILPAYEPDAQDERIFIDLDIEEVDDRVIYLVQKVRNPATGQKERREIAVEVPAPKMQHAFMIGRYQTLIQKQYARLSNTVNDREAEKINQEVISLNKKLVRLILPNIDDALLMSLNLRALNEIVQVAESMTQEAMSTTTSPLAYVRRIYRMMGEPSGKNDRNMLKWLREHFTDIEEIYGEADLPND